jgi:hypothetical protein
MECCPFLIFKTIADIMKQVKPVDHLTDMLIASIWLQSKINSIDRDQQKIERNLERIRKTRDKLKT